ncbi:proline-rich protein PRCC [Octopus sinensis]|uniref:Proline-rich protein PRCC n=1 Tax=Octopus sinensis TaxID=2607531 RepID=A0A6P7SZI4_9MOLL|nr:proline-rich protein PRCC [Octopus sinensis]
MSLVGYGSSDSSGSSDEEDNHLPPSGGRRTTNAASGVSKIESKPQNGVEEQQKAVINGTKSDNVSVGEEEDDLRGNNLFKVLPKPQEKQTVNDEISEGDLEDIVKPKSSQITSLPKPLPLLKGSHVKITIPALDSDSDEEEVVTKKKMKFSGKSRLLDILPPPRHISVKQSNRTFIPYTLNKRPEAAESATKKPPSSSIPKKPAVKKSILGVTGYNSDDDDDDDDSSSNFFSLDSKPQIPRQTDGSFTQPSATISSTITSTFHSLSSIPSVPWQQTTVSPLVPSATDVMQKDYAEYYVQPEELVQPEQDSLVTPDDDTELGGPSMNIDTLLQDEQFQRLQGKNQRGKEQIQLMNVNADDFIDKSLLTKTLTQEMPRHSYKKNKDAPSKKSRNKHQITYLAYQAKERELELKNQWSQNKMTKRQTQAKYGF